jgi:phosphate starvation-inducible PhoH-like protein
VAKQNSRSNAKRASRPNPREDRNPKSSSRSYRDNVVPFNANPEPRVKKKVELLPRNLRQEEYIELLEDQHNSVVFATGPAGTGKTLLCTLYAIKQLQEGNIDKIIITRPAVSVDEQHGFLPGTLLDKMAPWVIPITDVFKEFYSVQALEKMLMDEVVEIAPLAYMRGRTLKRSIILFDESQNATPNQMKMVLTRLGDESRMFVTGDIQQHDRGFSDNGLKDFMNRLALHRSNRIKLVRFDREDVERHPVIEEILTLYGEE